MGMALIFDALKRAGKSLYFRRLAWLFAFYICCSWGKPHSRARMNAMEKARLKQGRLNQWTVSACKLQVLILASCLLTGGAFAQSNSSELNFMKDAQRWLDQSVNAARPTGAAPLRMEVQLGQLDSRLRLAPCAKVEPYIPPGTRLWGKTRLGLRCLEGDVKWNVFLPVTVKAVGRAWVVKRDIASGVALTEGDLVEAEVDWAEEPSPIVADMQKWLGLASTRALTTGQSLRQNMIRPAQVFAAGAQVRVVAQGVGFQIASDGQAVSAGVVGQSARIRMENGRIMSGLVLDARTVRLEL
jgi:flagellar basal body P-ring formation protein FlgA